MGSIQKTVGACIVLALATHAAQAANIKANVIVAPPVDGMAYQVGEEVDVGIWLRGETVPVDDLELVQVDLKVTGAVIPDHDGDGAQDVFFAPFGPDGLPGPGSPGTSLLGSAPSSAGGGRIYYWIDILNLFDLPATDPGRGFINFTIISATPGEVLINAIGPCINDGSSSGAFAQQAASGALYTNCDEEPTRNWVQGIPGGPSGGGDDPNYPGIMITVVPEPAGVGLLALAVLALPRRGHRDRAPATRESNGLQAPGRPECSPGGRADRTVAQLVTVASCGPDPARRTADRRESPFSRACLEVSP